MKKLQESYQQMRKDKDEVKAVNDSGLRLMKAVAHSGAPTLTRGGLRAHCTLPPGLLPTEVTTTTATAKRRHTLTL